MCRNFLPYHHLLVIFRNSKGSLYSSGSPMKYPCGPPSQGVNGVEPELRIVSFTCFGVKSVELAFIRAAAAATDGAAMLVPLSTAYPPSRYVDSISTPGAAILIEGPKLLNGAKVSSVAFSAFNFGPVPPHFPSLSAIAETVITSGLLAGEVVVASLP